MTTTAPLQRNLREYLNQVKKKEPTENKIQEITAFGDLVPFQWRMFLRDDLISSEAKALELKIMDEFSQSEGNEGKKSIYPPKDKIFRSLELCLLDKTQVIILGQDPYHTPNQANGLAFSCEQNPLQPSLRNIFLEVCRDFGIVETSMRQQLLNGDLTPWAQQGVLLLNWTLTVRAHQAKSHSGFGWQCITRAIIRRLSINKKNLVFLLWGRDAHIATDYIVMELPQKHLILKSSHPSPYSYSTASTRIPSFERCNHFKQCNEYLEKHGIKGINWY